jgi:hypothetical protein
MDIETVARIAEALAVSWDTANDAVLAEGRRVLINDPTRFDGVRVIGVDEHWPTSTGRAPATARRRRSTDAWNIFADQRSASETSRTTSPDHYSRPADSDHNYTLIPDEPRNTA